MEWLTNLPTYIQYFFASVVGTALVQGLFKIGEQVLSNRINRDEQRFQEKKELGKAITAICLEGQSHGFTEKPKDEGKINEVLNELYQRKERVYANFQQMIAGWNASLSVLRTRHEVIATVGRTEIAQELRDTADHQAEQVLKEVHKWK